MKELSEKTTIDQQLFTQYCRTGQGDLPPGVREDRMHHYHRLISNIFGEILEDAFPVLMKKMSEQEWKNLCSTFVAEYPIQSYQSVRLPGEFVDFVQGLKSDFHTKYPFAKDLVRFEWIEMELYFRKNETIPEYSAVDEVEWDTQLVLNPYASLEQYAYPVFENLGSLENAESGFYFVLSLRKISDHQVHFIKLNPISAALIQQLQEAEMPVLGDFIPSFAEVLHVPEKEIKMQLAPFLKQMIQTQFILGIPAKK
ncbi:MAG: hypothetical protein ACI9YL_000138 [Luteibaculaceae bacterium]|jgi:hypothetical protein